ncbi:uncharacterized protein LOC105694661 [Orussus abietinus]|uniref:uncharacterized protein LOC105694661 n=1 Tax=Orussus abietinus TaxID=222816 RepID=UPI00062534B9|nr:uncharacterized protein LOC105694661 [Orussus abietinus]
MDLRSKAINTKVSLTNEINKSNSLEVKNDSVIDETSISEEIEEENHLVSNISPASIQSAMNGTNKIIISEIHKNEEQNLIPQDSPNSFYTDDFSEFSSTSSSIMQEDEKSSENSFKTSNSENINLSQEKCISQRSKDTHSQILSENQSFSYENSIGIQEKEVIELLSSKNKHTTSEYEVQLQRESDDNDVDTSIQTNDYQRSQNYKVKLRKQENSEHEKVKNQQSCPSLKSNKKKLKNISNRKLLTTEKQSCSGFNSSTCSERIINPAPNSSKPTKANENSHATINLKDKHIMVLFSLEGEKVLSPNKARTESMSSTDEEIFSKNSRIRAEIPQQNLQKCTDIRRAESVITSPNVTKDISNLVIRGSKPESNDTSQSSKTQSNNAIKRKTIITKSVSVNHVSKRPDLLHSKKSLKEIKVFSNEHNDTKHCISMPLKTFKHNKILNISEIRTAGRYKQSEKMVKSKNKSDRSQKIYRECESVFVQNAHFRNQEKRRRKTRSKPPKQSHSKGVTFLKFKPLEFPNITGFTRSEVTLKSSNEFPSLLRSRISEIQEWLKDQVILYRNYSNLASAINAKYVPTTLAGAKKVIRDMQDEKCNSTRYD